MQSLFDSVSDFLSADQKASVERVENNTVGDSIIRPVEFKTIGYLMFKLEHFWGKEGL